MIPKAIEVRKLSKKYGSTKAIDDLSFSVEKGEVVGFLGPNGAGKSTTLRILSGVIPATSGEAWVCGISVANNPSQAKKHIGYMPENNPLPEDLRVTEYLKFRAHLKGLPSREVNARVEEVMQICDLNRKAKSRLIGTLSKGFKQRVGIADVILNRPDIVIMDEPTIGLDPHQVLTIRKLIDQLRHNHTIILSSHILPEIEACCSKVIIINHGHIVAWGMPPDLKAEFINYNEYELQLRGDLEEFEEALAQFNSNLKITHMHPFENSEYSVIYIRTNLQEDVGEQLMRWVHQNKKWSLRQFIYHTPTLEDIFMLATKRSWEERMASKWKSHRMPDDQSNRTEAALK